MVDEAHNRGIRVVLDGVFNHASRGFFPFHDILENGPNSAYLDWFSIKDFPLYAYDLERSPNYQAWWGLPALPKFNINCPDVREFLWGIGRKWIEFGIDGWRLDVPNEIDDDNFWREFRTRVRAANPEAYIVGEVWTEAQRWLKGDMWDAVMNYQFTRACIAFFIGENLEEADLRKTSLFPAGATTAEAFRRNIESLLGLYHPNVTGVMLNLLSSHDMARFVTLAKGDFSALRLATLFQMTYPGAPSIYYGDEIGLAGGHDPANRGAFPWHQTDSWNTELLHEYQRLIALRHARPSLRRGAFQFLWASGNVVSYARQLATETTIVVLNASHQTSPAGPASGQPAPRGNSPLGMLVARLDPGREGKAARPECSSTDGACFYERVVNRSSRPGGRRVALLGGICGWLDRIAPGFLGLRLVMALGAQRAARKSERRCFEKSFLSLMARIPVQKGFLSSLRSEHHRASVASSDRLDEGRMIPAQTTRARSRSPRVYESILGE